MLRTTATDLRQQVGQLLILGFEGFEAGSHLRKTLAKLQPAGIILFSRNIENCRQTWNLLRELQATNAVPMFLCVDLEGGAVDRLKDVIAPTPSAEQVFSTGNRRLWRMHGSVLGLEARALGFNTDFAPVFDLGLPASRSVLASRTASGDPQKVAAYAREFLRGLKAAKVLGCGKHFPGLGGANLDSHHAMPVVRKPWKQMWAEDLLPYRQLHRQLALVMTAHACYPSVTKDNLPTTFSRKWMTDILRVKIGYRGLILADDLEMGGALSAGPMEEIAVETLRAGADLFLVCHNLEMACRGYEAVLREAERDRKFAVSLRRASRRVLSVKQRSPELPGFAAEPKASMIEKLKQVMNRFSDLAASEGPARRFPEAPP